MKASASKTQNLLIGLDLGGTFLKYALGTPEGEIIYKNKMPSRANENKAVIFRVIFSAIKELVAVAENENNKIRAIGFGSPGAVDFDSGKLIGSTPNIRDWADAEIRKEIESKFSIPVWADNDANVMALAEARVGAGKGYKYIICLTLGTGIGGGIIIDGQLFRGSRFAGSELGHISIQYDGFPCKCGGIGCLEQYASASAMVRLYKNKLKNSHKNVPANLNTELIFKQSQLNDNLAIETIDETCEYLGTGMASIANALNPEIFILGGGLSEAGDGFIKKAHQVLVKRAMKPVTKDLKVLRATLGNDAGMVGAIMLASEMSIN